MFKRILLVCLSLVMFAMAFSANVKASDYPSNTGYWVESGDNTYYCEWSYFSTTCKSGSTSSKPPVVTPPVVGG